MRRSAVAAAVLLLVAALAHSSMAAEAQVVVGSVSEPHEQVDEATLQAANTAVTLLNEDASKLSLALGKAQNGGEAGPVSLLGVASVRTQVVAGINYFFTLRVADAHGAPHEVKLTLWARPWLQNSNSGEKAFQLTHVESV